MKYRSRQFLNMVKLPQIQDRISTLRLICGVLVLSAVFGFGVQESLADTQGISVQLEPRSITVVDPEVLSFTGGKSKTGLPPGIANFGLQNPRHRVGDYGNLSLTFIFGHLDGDWSLFVAKSSDGTSQLTPADFVRATEIEPIGTDGANGRSANISIPLDDGSILNIEARALFGPGLLLHRNMSLQVGEVKAGSKNIAIGLIHYSSGIGFDDLEQLNLLVDSNGDGFFSEGEQFRTGMPVRVGEKQMVLKHVTPNGSQAEFTQFDSEYALAKGFLIPEAEFFTLDGKKIQLAPSQGKWQVINVWAMFCRPCISEIPVLTSLAEEFKDQDNVEFIAVSPGSANQLRTFLEKHPFGYQILWSEDKDNPLFAQGYPWHIILDPAGRIRHLEFGGTFSQAHLSGILKQLLNES